MDASLCQFSQLLLSGQCWCREGYFNSHTQSLDIICLLWIHQVVFIPWAIRYLFSSESFWQVWISFAKFELSIGDENCVAMSRSIYKEAHRRLKNADEKEERLVLLEAWKDFEVRDHQICSNDFYQSIYAKTTALLFSSFSVICFLELPSNY